MRVQPLWKLIVLSLLISLFLVSCGNEEVVPTLTITPLPTPTNKPIATPLAAATRAWPQAVDEIEYITVAIDAPSRTRQFSDFDPFGHVIGFEADLMEEIRTRTNWQYEFVVTPFDGMLASVAEGEFDVALSAIAVPAEPVAGVAFTNPYLEIGQVLVVRADETVIQATTDLQPGMPVQVVIKTGERTLLTYLLHPLTKRIAASMKEE